MHVLECNHFKKYTFFWLPLCNPLLIVHIRLLRGRLLHSATSTRACTCSISGDVPHCCGHSADDWKHGERFRFLHTTVL